MLVSPFIAISLLVSLGLSKSLLLSLTLTHTHLHIHTRAHTHTNSKLSVCHTLTVCPTVVCLHLFCFLIVSSKWK